MSSTPSAESLWRAARRDQDAAQLIDQCARLIPLYHESMVDEGGDPQIVRDAISAVALPGAIPYNVFCVERRNGNTLWTDTRITTAAQAIAFFAAYRDTKRIYRFTRELTEGLTGTQWPDAYPANAITLPGNGCVIELDYGERGVASIGAYLDLATGAETTGWHELRLVLLTNDDAPPFDRVMTLAILDLAAGGSLHDAWESAFRKGQYYSIQRGLSSHPIAEVEAATRDAVSSALNALLFVQSGDDVALTVPSGKIRQPADPAERARLYDLRDPAQYDVGTEYARIMRDYGRSVGHAGGTVQPHMRRAHAHLYWTGQGRTIPRVRFLAPISVRGGGPE